MCSLLLFAVFKCLSLIFKNFILMHTCRVNLKIFFWIGTVNDIHIGRMFH